MVKLTANMQSSLLALFVFILAGVLTQDTNASLSEEHVVAKIDHIVVQTENPGQLFSMMTETFDLPVAWPIAAYPGFTTGGIHAGNVNIEFLRFNEAQNIQNFKARIYGIVFEPTSLGENISELKNRGVDPSEPEPQYSRINGTDVKVWTNVMLNGLFGQDYIVYLVEYGREDASKLSKRLPAKPGPLGKIGMLSVKEIVVGTTDVNKTRNIWQRFLGFANPANTTAPDTWQIGESPAIYLVHGERDTIESMVWSVESLDRAKASLENTHMLGTSSEKDISIDPSKVQGLNIKLVED
jgi:hypothetical protein